MLDIDTPRLIIKEIHQNGVYETPCPWLLGSCYRYLAYIIVDEYHVQGIVQVTVLDINAPMSYITKVMYQNNAL